MWEKYVRRVTPYVPGEQPKDKNIIKLNTNENPYPPSPLVASELNKLSAEELRLYPDPTNDLVISALSEAYNMPKENIFAGVGSDDVLAMCFLTFFNSEKPILFPDITYSFYKVWAELFRIPYEERPLRGDFSVNPLDYKKENGGIVIANPNAPTGLVESREFFEDVAKLNPSSVIIIDEAYVDFGAESMLPLVKEFDNVLVVQTFSKSRSMAGSRIGYAFGSKRLISCLNDVKFSFNSYTMDTITQRLAAAELSDPDHIRETSKKIMETREWTKKELSALGFQFGDSKANFIFATHPKAKAVDIYEMLRGVGIYVRHFKKPERIENYLRITIGTREEMARLMGVLRGYLSEKTGDGKEEA